MYCDTAQRRKILSKTNNIRSNSISGKELEPVPLRSAVKNCTKKASVESDVTREEFLKSRQSETSQIGAEMGVLSNKSCTTPFSPWHDFFAENWSWDCDHHSPDVYLCNSNKIACFHIDPVCQSRGTAAVRGNKAFTHGQHYWEVKLTDVYGTSVMVGVGTKDAVLHTDNYEFVNLLGRDSQSWGLSHKGEIWHDGKKQKFCEPFFDSTIIGVLLDMDKGTLSYFKDGESLGVAFSGLMEQCSEFYPIASSTATESEIELGSCSCKYSSLIDQCCIQIARHVDRDKMDSLPLPKSLCRLLKST